MFSNPKNRGKIFSFFIALSIVIITTFFVNENKKEVERISGRIAGIDKKMEADLSLFLLAKSDFTQAMLYNTLGMLHMENGHSFKTLFVPFQNAVLNGVIGLNEAVGNSQEKLTKEQIESIADEFATASYNNDVTAFVQTFFNTNEVIALLNKAYKNNTEQKATDKVRLKAQRETLNVEASLLTWIAAIIGFVQLFFNTFYDMYLDYKKNKTLTP